MHEVLDSEQKRSFDANVIKYSIYLLNRSIVMDIIFT